VKKFADDTAKMVQEHLDLAYPRQAEITETLTTRRGI